MTADKLDSRAFAGTPAGSRNLRELYRPSISHDACLEDTLVRLYVRKSRGRRIPLSVRASSGLGSLLFAWLIHAAALVSQATTTSRVCLVSIARPASTATRATISALLRYGEPAERLARVKQGLWSKMAAGYVGESLGSSRSGVGCSGQGPARSRQGNREGLSSCLSQGSSATTTTSGRLPPPDSAARAFCDAVQTGASRSRTRSLSWPSPLFILWVMVAFCFSGAVAAPPVVVAAPGGLPVAATIAGVGMAAAGVTAAAQTFHGMDMLSTAAGHAADSAEQTEIADRPLPYQAYQGPPKMGLQADHGETDTLPVENHAY